MTQKDIPIFKSRLPEVIQTSENGLVMRLLRKEDSADFYKLGLDPDVAEYNNYNVKSLDDAKSKIESFIQETNNLQRMSYAIIKNGKFAGYYGVWIEDDHPNYFREGIAIMPEFRRRGIYTICSQAVADILSGIYDRVWLVNNVNKKNQASITASKSKGFYQDGCNELGELRFIKKVK